MTRGGIINLHNGDCLRVTCTLYIAQWHTVTYNIRNIESPLNLQPQVQKWIIDNTWVQLIIVFSFFQKLKKKQGFILKRNLSLGGWGSTQSLFSLSTIYQTKKIFLISFSSWNLCPSFSTWEALLFCVWKYLHFVFSGVHIQWAHQWIYKRGGWEINNSTDMNDALQNTNSNKIQMLFV